METFIFLHIIRYSCTYNLSKRIYSVIIRLFLQISTHACNSRFRKYIFTDNPSTKRNVASFKAFTSSERTSSSEVKLSVDERQESTTEGKEEGGAERIENEGKANNGVFSFCAHVGGNNRRLSAHRWFEAAQNWALELNLFGFIEKERIAENLNSPKEAWRKEKKG